MITIDQIKKECNKKDSIVILNTINALIYESFLYKNIFIGKPLNQCDIKSIKQILKNILDNYFYISAIGKSLISKYDINFKHNNTIIIIDFYDNHNFIVFSKLIRFII